MAEEIYIEVVRPESPCISCDRVNGISCFAECDKLIKYKKEYPFRGGTFSRTEAIDIIAKALCADDVMREGYYQLAEAVLNALLKGEK